MPDALVEELVVDLGMDLGRGGKSNDCEKAFGEH